MIQFINENFLKLQVLTQVSMGVIITCHAVNMELTERCKPYSVTATKSPYLIATQTPKLPRNSHVPKSIYVAFTGLIYLIT